MASISANGQLLWQLTQQPKMKIMAWHQNIRRIMKRANSIIIKRRGICAAASNERLSWHGGGALLNKA